jgi:Bifunctional DNA primase/polymerase, N-terminal
VLDVDGQAGRESLTQLLAHFGLESVADLTSVICRTPSGGLHLFFRWQQGETPRNRARDIGPGLDTRGVTAEARPAGYFIAPGSVLPDGRSYEFVDPAALAEMDERA